MEINYRKNNNKQLFDNFNNSDFLDIENSQNYFPLYNTFFNLNSTNYNAINLNNKYKLELILEKINYNKFLATITDICNNKYNKEVFVKFSPLIDPVKYMIGKYENNYNILELPKFIDRENLDSDSDLEYSTTYKKILDPNNSAYIDGFFSFLSSCLLNNYNFYNGLDYYGAFLGVKNKFKYNVTEDLEYLNESDYFHKHKNSLFIFEDNEKIFNLFNNTKKNKKPLVLNETDDDLNINDLIISDLADLNLDNTIIKSSNNSELIVEETHNTNLELTLTYENLDILINNKQTSNSNTNSNTGINTTNSSDTCSSRSSNTGLVNSVDSGEDDDESSEESFNSEEIFCSIDKIPVEMIVLECCENTLDDYIVK
jgi:hypothetical protein